MIKEGIRIVIINDDPNDVSLLRQCLINESGQDYSSVEAKTGEMGVQACLEPDSRRPDCVIVDLHLPDMSGLDVLKRLKNDAGEMQCPVVFFIDSGEECKAATAALRAGAHDYIAKSWLTAEGLACAVENAIERFKLQERLRTKRAALERQDREFKALVENVPDIITRFDTESRHVYINPAIERATGIPPESFLGKTSREAGMPAKLCDFWESVLKEAMVGGRELTFEFGLRTPAGLRCFQTRLVPQFSATGEVDSVLAVLTDVTEGKRAEEVLQASEEHLRNVIDQLIAFVGVMTPSGILVEANRPALEVAALRLEDVLGKPLEDTYWWSYSPELQADLRRAIECAARGEKVRRDVLIRIGNDHFITLDFMIAPLIDAQGNVTHLISSGVDITERKRSEQALRDSDRRKDEFLAMLAHELRNPLAAIRTAVHILMLKGKDQPELTWSREVIERQAKHLSRLIEDLLDVSRISTGKIQLKPVPVDVRDVVRRAAEAVLPLMTAKQHELTIILPPQPLSALADPARLEQVVSNLLTNAAKYTDNRGSITLTGDREGSSILLRVRDNGIGIEPEMLPHVFDLYTQVHGNLARSQGGLGIGLTLVKMLVEMHRGSVTAASDGPGKGSEFAIRLPAMDSRHGPPGEAVRVEFKRSQERDMCTR